MSRLERAVDRAIRTFELHPECRSCKLSALDDQGATVELTLNVEMPLAWRAHGESPNGVRREETAAVRFRADYPWSAPRFTLRPDFDRSLPHIEPGHPDGPPEPCLVFGSLDEYFLEVGLLSLVDQLCLWLERAAKGALINATQGWEPIVRNRLVGEYVMDAEYIRGLVDRFGGCAILRTQQLRSGATDDQLGDDARVFGRVYSERTTLTHSEKSPLVAVEQLDRNHTAGHGIAIVAWPGRTASGDLIVESEYFPETVETLNDLLTRAEALHCKSPLEDCLDRLDRVFTGLTLALPVPIPVIFCVRRPIHLISIDSDIELLPYAFDLRLDADRPPIKRRRDLPVIPVAQLDAPSPGLLKSASGAPDMPSVAVLGAGSVGSKVALHLARNGTTVVSVVDNQWLRPHNLARHGLAQTPHDGKASALAKALGSLGQSTQPHEVDVLSALADPAKRRRVLPRETGFVIDTTASLQVRSRISDRDRANDGPRYASIALFGEGQGAYLLMEGVGGTPTLDDVANEYYAQLVANDLLRAAATSNDGELRHVATGQGCGSLTMRMTDARVSAMTALVTEQLVAEATAPKDRGLLLYGVQVREMIDSQWTRLEIEAPEEVDIGGADGWQFRLSSLAVATIRAEVVAYPAVETGGILMGRVNERLRTINVVDVLQAPPDSQRSPGGFVLGVEGGQEQVQQYHDRSGRTLYDVGTWHSHLMEMPPSPRDRSTAAELTSERPPPYALLIVTPSRFYGLMHED